MFGEKKVVGLNWKSETIFVIMKVLITVFVCSFQDKNCVALSACRK